MCAGCALFGSRWPGSLEKYGGKLHFCAQFFLGKTWKILVLEDFFFEKNVGNSNFRRQFGFEGKMFGKLEFE